MSQVNSSKATSSSLLLPTTDFQLKKEKKCTVNNKISTSTIISESA